MRGDDHRRHRGEHGDRRQRRSLSDGAVVVPAGFAAASMAQQRCGILPGRGAEDGHCAMQQAIARSSAMAARGAATAIRAVMPTARTITQAVSRFRDTEAHCMSGRSN
jgi:hypothetical protein